MKLKAFGRVVKMYSWAFFILIGLALGHLWGTPSQSDLEAEEFVGYVRGCRETIQRLHEDTVLLKWIVYDHKHPLDPTDKMPAVELHPDMKIMPDSIWDSFNPLFFEGSAKRLPLPGVGEMKGNDPR